jgi:hypothetical protein
MPKHKGYWQDLGNVRLELDSFIKEFFENTGRIPNTSEVKKINPSLIYSTYSFGGYSQVLSLLGYARDESIRGHLDSEREKIGKKAIKPMGYWEVFQNVENELRPIADNFISQYERLPSSKDLKKIGRDDILGAVTHHGGLNKTYEKLKYNIDVKPHGYWKNFTNLKKELDPIAKELGHFPNSTELRKMGRLELLTPITFHHGFHAVSERLGYSFNKPPKYWKDFDNVKIEIGKIVTPFLEKENRLPKSKDYISMGRGDFLNGVQKYHGGLKNIYKKLGYKNRSQIETSDDFIDFIKSEENVRLVLERFGGNVADVADTLSVMYGDRISSERCWEFLDDPSLGKYLGGFIKPLGGIGDLLDIGTHILQLDKGGVIKDIIYRSAQRHRREKLGAMPSDKERSDYLTELSTEIKKLDSIGNPKSHEMVTNQIAKDLLGNTLRLFNLYENGIDGLAKRVKTP